MDIIERTQYSSDGGETWADTEREARADHVHAELAKKMGAGWANNVLHTIETYPDALIQAMRDMGALPKVNEDWAAYINSDVGAAFKRGSKQAIEYIVTTDDGFEFNSQRYAVIPVEQHAKEKAALARVIKYAQAGFASACDWCDAHGVNWEDE